MPETQFALLSVHSIIYGQRKHFYASGLKILIFFLKNEVCFLVAKVKTHLFLVAVTILHFKTFLKSCWLFITVLC